MAHKVEKIKDIIPFAMEREIEANELYLYMAASMTNPQIRTACENFAKDELDHKTKLEQELLKIDETAADLNLADYVMVAGNPMNMDDEDLLIFAIKKEQLSIDLYNNLAAMVKDKESQRVLKFLIKEETDHKQRFETEYQSLKK